MHPFERLCLLILNTFESIFFHQGENQVWIRKNTIQVHTFLQGKVMNKVTCVFLSPYAHEIKNNEFIFFFMK